MRRLVAILLLVAFGSPLAGPLLAMAPVSEASLPACCRSHGKHHCGMGAAEREQLLDRKAAFHAAPERCPYSATLSTAFARTLLLGAPQGQSALLGNQGQDAVCLSAQPACRTARERAGYQRGPPLFLQLPL